MALYRSDPYSIMDDQLFSNISIFDMDNDLYDMDKLLSSSTIQSDLEKIEDMEKVFQDYDLEEDMKPEIRNIDCMWPAMASCLTSGNVNGMESGESAASSYSETGAVSLAMVSGTSNLYSAYQRSQTTDNTQSNQQQVATNPENMPVIIKKELADPDYNIVCQKRLRLSGVEKKSQIQDDVHLIPPGGSLLRKRNNQTLDIRKAGELSGGDSIKYQRPDTPHSLTDEVAATEFRHNVDLRACVMGSNNISLTSNDSDVNYIKQISRELQNSGKDPLPVRYIPPINDVLDVLTQHSNSMGGQQQLNQQQMDEQQQAIDIATALHSTVDSPPTTGSDSDSDDGESHNFDLRHHRTSKSGSNASTASNNNIIKTKSNKSNKSSSNGMLHMMHITDHSYTRCNDMVDDGPNLETPSDSDEEIDVVSYTDKKLPTNPSCHLMGALQFQMAHKISSDHMKQKPRYNNFNLPYTPASSSPVKSVANSRYPSPSSTPYQNCSSASPSYSPLSVDSSNVSSSSSSSSSQSSFTTSSSNKGRKRSCLKDPGLLISSSSVYLPGVNNKVTHSSMMSKKSRGKKVATLSGNTSPMSSGQDVDPMDRNWQRRSGGGIATSTTSSSSAHRKDFVLGFDEADTIEKRNQHNDMERQRRIGLKNLFEALKKQIPTIRDKERAPKVNILREAAKLCIQLTQEEHELSVQRQLLSLQLKQHQDLLDSYRSDLNKSRSVSG
ncbi:myc protein [Drosophila simulans]|uniref:Myc n=2 Tax=Drosophila simulans TaxID=7240 RepID=A0AA97IQH4_DROSI|nr:myc protein [Drosophila simulans]XP_016037970.1 myc protein [Drosophila simulans]KMZ08030.1 uncharacterized protein Dsimw501_GD16640, isoform B [Drosophila simulans]KMZ08031.1 uncharacterized protein Dsimw501_GD16640, isoform C [Drosophila simulans]DBA35942.1 TPA: Myc [Drosophila simulans]DBA35943.1 TPA: Myc [Drosophila simulans]